MTLLGTVQMLLLAGCLFGILTSVACSITTPHLVRWTATWAPASRHRALVLLAFAPWMLSLAGLCSVMLPSLLGTLWPAHDHCLVHAGHSHLCLMHPSHHVGAWTGWALITGVGAWLTTQLMLGALVLLRASRVVRELSRHARYDAARALWIVPSDEVLCVSVGLLRPRLMVSDGLLDTAPIQGIEIMSAHEEAHIRRKDSLVRLLVRAATVPLMPDARRTLRATLELCAEQACDEHAAANAGDRLRVAETILAVERRLDAASGLRCSPLVAAFGSSFVPERVEAMLQPVREAGACARLVGVLGVMVAVVLGAYEPLHHATESLLSVFSH